MSNAFAMKHGRMREGIGTTGGVARAGRPILVILTVGIAVFFLARFVALPLLTISRVVVESDVPLSQTEILASAGLRGTQYWHSLKAQAVRAKLEENLLVRRAEVSKVFPRTLRIVLYRRQAAALLIAESEGKSVLVLADGAGLIFKVAKTAAEVDLPVVSGIALGKAGLGAEVPRHYAPLFSDLALLREKSPSLYGLISEIAIAPLGIAPLAAGGAAEASGSSPAGYEVAFYLSSFPVPIRCRGKIDEAIVRYSLMVLELLSKQGVLGDIEELDFRSSEAVYRMKEG